MPKDKQYHEAAIFYNDELARFADELVASIEHPDPQNWCRSIAKQHRFHARCHRESLEKLEMIRGDLTAEELGAEAELAFVEPEAAVETVEETPEQRNERLFAEAKADADMMAQKESSE